MYDGGVIGYSLGCFYIFLILAFRIPRELWEVCDFDVISWPIPMIYFQIEKKKSYDIRFIN